MTKKDYIKIAAALKDEIEELTPDSPRWESAKQIAVNLCPVFKADNPNFDRDRFLTACGLV